MDKATGTSRQVGPSAEPKTGERKQPRVRRRRLVKTAAVAVAGAVAASGYVQPSVRPLQVPVAHAFSF